MGRRLTEQERIDRSAVDAVRSKNISLVAKALDAGANPNAEDREGLSLLILSMKSPLPNIGELLLRRGADVNSGGSKGRPPLVEAAKTGAVELGMAILERSVDVNVRDADGASALHFAAVAANTPFCQALIDQGADIHALDNNGKDPLTYAYENRRHGTAWALVLHGADKSKVPSDQTFNMDLTNLQGAARFGFPKFVLSELDRQANDPNIETIIQDAIDHTRLPYMPDNGMTDLIRQWALRDAARRAIEELDGPGATPVRPR